MATIQIFSASQPSPVACKQGKTEMGSVCEMNGVMKCIERCCRNGHVIDIPRPLSDSSQAESLKLASFEAHYDKGWARRARRLEGHSCISYAPRACSGHESFGSACEKRSHPGSSCSPFIPRDHDKQVLGLRVSWPYVHRFVSTDSELVIKSFFSSLDALGPIVSVRGLPHPTVGTAGHPELLVAASLAAPGLL